MWIIFNVFGNSEMNIASFLFESIDLKYAICDSRRLEYLLSLCTVQFSVACFKCCNFARLFRNKKKSLHQILRIDLPNI